VIFVALLGSTDEQSYGKTEFCRSQNFSIAFLIALNWVYLGSIFIDSVFEL